jgi:predicted HicB family RNase H-like nuclease
MKKEPSATIKVKTNIYIPAELHAALQTLARQERRSLNSEIIWLLEQTVANKEKKEPPDAIG